MTRVNMTKFKADMKKVLEEFESPKMMREIGDIAVERIVKRTRLGKGVETTGGPPQSLKPLSQSYRDTRKGKVAFFTDKRGQVRPYTPEEPPKLSSLTSAGKSNLTFSGQMLDAVRVLSVRAGVALIGVANSMRRREQGKSLMSNAEVAGFVSKDRPFLNLSAPELQGLQKAIRERLQALIKKL